MPQQSAVFAVLATPHGPHKVRVTEPMSDGLAAIWHESLHRSYTTGTGSYSRRVSYPGYSVYGRPVGYFAVRSMDDPAWPADAPVVSVREHWEGTGDDPAAYHHETSLRVLA